MGKNSAAGTGLAAPQKSIGNVYFNDTDATITIKGSFGAAETFDYKDILSCEVLEDQTSVSKTALVRIVGTAAAFGVAGAVAGAALADNKDLEFYTALAEKMVLNGVGAGVRHLGLNGISHVAAGAVAGVAVGAVVGLVSGGRKNKDYCTSLRVKLTIRGDRACVRYIDLISSKTNKRGMGYRNAFNQAQELVSALQIAADKASAK